MKNILKVFLAILLVGAFAYTGYEISILSDRVQKIENKLGGPEKIAYNEKGTVEKVRRSVVRIIGGEGEGSGFAFEKGGLILTNFHVIASEPSPKVVLPDNTFEIGQIIMADKDADLAVIKIKKDLPPLNPARSGEISPAEEILAIGYPLGGTLSGESFVVRGSFSRFAKDKEIGVQYLLTDMTMVSGISGGPMVNICGDVVGINTAGLVLGGMGMAVSADSIRERYKLMAASENPLKDVKKSVFMPHRSAIESVRAFYNYLKARQLEKAYELLGENFLNGGSFEKWSIGYKPLLDTTIIYSRLDKKVKNRVIVKLSTKDLIEDEIVYKYFEGYWDVARQRDGRWLLWKPRIKEVKEPDEDWFYDQNFIDELNEFKETHEDAGEYGALMHEISQEPGNGELSMQELYDEAKKRVGEGT